MFWRRRANVYGLDAQTGAQLWKLKVDDHALARITGAPTLPTAALRAGVVLIEEVPGARLNYPCCTFRGSVVAIDAASGKQLWKTYMIPEAEDGRQELGGHAALETRRRRDLDIAHHRSRKSMIYVATGNAYTEPAAPTSDAVVALDLTTAQFQWTTSDARTTSSSSAASRASRLPGRCGTGLRLRQLADPQSVARWPPHPLARSEVRRGLRSGSG